jgi:hypothetical protein
MNAAIAELAATPVAEGSVGVVLDAAMFGVATIIPVAVTPEKAIKVEIRRDEVD